MAKKYYAVAKGRTPGIYFSWEDCKEQIDHFPGAVYKSFQDILEAERFIQGVKEVPAKKKSLKDNKNPLGQMQEKGKEQPVSTESHLIAYVDGSYDHRQRRYAYGCVLILPDETVTLNGSGAEADYVDMRNVAGEIFGSERAIDWAIEHGYIGITIYYDYEGIEKWANGSWKANKIGTRSYQAFVAEKRKKLDISFQKVTAHAGVTYNEMADHLAKEALGLL